jgi:hypothetical protein
MGIPQWRRADFIVEQFKGADEADKDIAECRQEIKAATEREFTYCHDCLLLAVYGFYKNGYIKNTPRQKTGKIDMNGFNNRESEDIKHAFDALSRLRSDPTCSATTLKHELGGEQSIYSFVVHYFNNNRLDLTAV